MDYISATEAARAWGVSDRQVQRLLAAGRVPGVKKHGVSWLIPADAQKPLDPRKARRLGPDSAPRYLACGLLTALIPMPKADPDAALVALPEAQRAQYAAELAYLRGDFAAVKAHYARVSPTDATYLCAANIAICAAMCTRDYPLFKRIAASVKEIETTAPADARTASLLPVLAAVCMNAPEMAPDWLRKGDFSDFPVEARPLLVFMRIKYLQSVKDPSGVLAAAQTARSLYMRKDAFTLVDIYFTCFCACGSYALGRLDDTRAYLLQSVALCEPGGFVSPLGEYTTWVGGLLEVALKKSAPAFEEAVLAHIETTLKNWLFFHNEFARDNASLILTTKEYQLALLLKEGKTYAQAASQLCLSLGRTRNLISILYGKLGVSRKAEVAELVY